MVIRMHFSKKYRWDSDRCRHVVVAALIGCHPESVRLWEKKDIQIELHRFLEKKLYGRRGRQRTVSSK